MYKLSLKRILMILAVCALGIFYSVPNFIKDAKTTLPSWWQPVNLGLDLQGGSSLLLEVDLDSALKDRMENLEDSARSALREAKVRYQSISSNEKGLRIKIDNPNTRTKAHAP
ncbi:MAG: protein translocase subunit SecD, partial [Alphaproteobacteria bacterium]|nr:protein translocase subunit SecD [Alphaproteobacteria bacterium]